MTDLTERQQQMLDEYIKKDNERLEQEFEEANVFYSLTLEAKAILSARQKPEAE